MLRNMISVSRIVEVRRKAMRRRVWYKVLSRIERSILNLTVRCVEKIRSTTLTKIVTVILTKLNEVMESQIEKMVRTVGRSIAQKVSRIAQKWGNKSSATWSKHKGFIQYLTIMDLNKP